MNKDNNPEKPQNSSMIKVLIEDTIGKAEGRLRKQIDAIIKLQIDELRAEFEKRIAVLRAENSERGQQMKVLESKLQFLEEYVKEDLRNKIPNLQQLQLRQKLEDKAANFLSGDGGLLFNVAEMLNQADKCVASANSKEIDKFLGFFIWPLDNKLVIYDRKIDTPAAVVDENLSLEELMNMYKGLLDANRPTPNLDIMDALSPVLHQLTDSEFEANLEKLPPEQAAQLIKEKATEIANELKNHGIGIIYEPDDSTIRFFAKPKSEEAPRPLVIRLSDQLVYTNGISEKADEQQSLY